MTRLWKHMTWLTHVVGVANLTLLFLNLSDAAWWAVVFNLVGLAGALWAARMQYRWHEMEKQMEQERLKRGDDFAAALADLARQMHIEPGHAIECFGKVAAMLSQVETMTGRARSTEDSLQFVMAAFMRGIGQVYPVEGSTKVTAHKTH